MPIPIHHLIQGQAPLVGVGPGDTLEHAVGLMIEHDYSQLPVIQSGRPHGKPACFVTSGSVARALRYFGAPLKELRVSDALIIAPTISAEDDVFDRLEEILGAYAVLVLNGDRTVAGIVTNHDTTQYFRRRAEDMLLVEDIETTLKDHIRSAYGGDEGDPDGALQAAVKRMGNSNDRIREKCRRNFRKFCGERKIPVTDTEVVEYVDSAFGSSERTFEKLTLYDYIELASRPEAWAKLGSVFQLPREAFRAMLDDVLNTRNKLMHFRADDDAVERDRLRFCAQWFKFHPAPLLESRGAGAGNLNPDTAPNPPATSWDDTAPDYSADDGESKYAPLAEYLSRVPPTEERVALTFTEIEEIVGSQLPASAREHRAWWSNDTTAHVQAAQWLDVNWRVVSINMTMERVVFARARDRERAYIGFFSNVQSRLRELDGFPLVPASPTGQNWMPIGSYPGTGITLVVSFARRKRLRLEFYIDTGEDERNKALFRDLHSHREHLESAVGMPLEWEQLENRRACRIALYTSGSITDDPADLEKLLDWVREFVPRLDHGIFAIAPLSGESETATVAQNRAPDKA